MDIIATVLGDLFCGAFSGAAMIMSSHPFDTVKVRMQMGAVGLFNTIAQMYRKEGFFGFYKGMGFPLGCSLPIAATLFSSFEFYQRHFKVDLKNNYSSIHAFLGGMYAGFCVAFIESPGELAKIILQLQTDNKIKRYTGPIDCTIDIWKNEKFKGVYKGFVATQLRDIPQFGLYFLSYEFIKHKFIEGKTNDDLGILQQLIAGGAAGFISIIGSYPQDIIKTKIQTEVLIPKHLRVYTPTYYDGGCLKCLKEIIKIEGHKGLWIGFTSCSMFYIVSSAMQFLSYEMSRKLWFNLFERSEFE